MATKTRSSAARKPSTGTGTGSHTGTTGGARKSKSRARASSAKKDVKANPFKKTADAIRQTQEIGAEATQNAFNYGQKFTKQAQKATSDATKDAFANGSQFNQASEWMRNGTEAMQSMFTNAMQSFPMMGANSFTANGAGGKNFGAKGANGFGMPGFGMPGFGMPGLGTPGLGMPNSGSLGMEAQASRATEAANRGMSEIIALSTEQMQALSESSSAVANMAKDIGQEVVQSANTIFTDQVELSKAMLQCRNVDDMMELHGKASQMAMDHFFNESVRLSELAFKYASDMAEPMQQRMTQMGERLSKIAAA